MTEHGSNIYEPMPIPNDNPAVWDLVLEDIHKRHWHAQPDVWNLVVEDIKKRNEMGIQKYGTPLQPHNGRDCLWDAYQEALDLTVYLRQALFEHGQGMLHHAYMDALGLLGYLRGIIYKRDQGGLNEG